HDFHSVGLAACDQAAELRRIIRREPSTVAPERIVRPDEVCVEHLRAYLRRERDLVRRSERHAGDLVHPGRNHHGGEGALPFFEWRGNQEANDPSETNRENPSSSIHGSTRFLWREASAAASPAFLPVTQAQRKL